MDIVKILLVLLLSLIAYYWFVFDVFSVFQLVIFVITKKIDLEHFLHFLCYYNSKLGNFFHSHYTQARSHTHKQAEEISQGAATYATALGAVALLKGTSAVPRM